MFNKFKGGTWHHFLTSSRDLASFLTSSREGLALADFRFRLDKTNSTHNVVLINCLTRFLGNNNDNMESHSLWKNL